MGTTLNGTTPQATYESMLKLGDNSALSNSLKRISDGEGNDTPIEISDAAVQFGGSTGMFWDNTNKRLGIGTNSPSRALSVSAPARLSDLNIGLTTSTSIGNTNNIILNWGTTGVGVASGSAITATATFQVKGSGTTSATTSLLVQNSAGSTMFGILDNSRVFFGNSAANQPYITNFDGVSTEGGNGQALRIRQQANINGILMQYFADGLFNNTTSGNNISHDFIATGYRGATGNGNYNALRLGYTINNVSASTQTGIARGILVNATETSLEGMLHKLMDLQVGGSSKFEVLSTGSTAVSINSTTQGFLPPRMTTAQKNAIVTPAAGLVVFDTTLAKLCVYTTAWETITSV